MATREGAGRLALITGASSGIGSALARVVAENGFDLVLTARSETRLQALADELSAKYRVRAEVVVEDLTDRAAPERILRGIERSGRHVSMLVNDAGYGVGGTFRMHAWSVHEDFLQVMVSAVVNFTHLVEPAMLKDGYGRILNVASLAGLAPGSAGQTLYAAAKSFVIKFSESMSLEHQGDGIHVTALCPGFTNQTGFHRVAGSEERVRRLPSYLWMDAERVAREGYAAVSAGRAVCIPGSVNRSVAAFLRMLPATVALGIMRRQSPRLRAQE